MTDTDSQRLFLALWPDDATRDGLNRTGKWLHQHWGGRRMRADTLHLTLAFLGSTPAKQRDALIAGADSIRAEAFELILDQSGYWPHNRIGWLGCAQPAAPLADLADSLRDMLRKTSVAFDSKPFVQHVTLLRNTPGGSMPACTPVVCLVRDFVLVASRTEAASPHYDIVKRWPLA